MTQDPMPPAWRRLQGVSPGTWRYVHQRSIARRYDEFVASTPLCALDLDYVTDHFHAQRNHQGATNCSSDRPLVIDLGCGTGRLAMPISQLGFHVLAVDLSAPMLEELLSRDATNDQAVGDIVPLRASLVELGCIGDNVADHAICMFSTLGMISESDNRVDCLKHVRRIVRAGGTFVFHVHRRWAALREPGGRTQLVKSLIASRRNASAEFGDWTYDYRGLPDMFMHRFDRRELLKLLDASGWNLDRIDRISLDGRGLTTSRWKTGGYFVVCSKPAD